MRSELIQTIEGWLADPGSAVEYAEEVEGRWAVRISQETRDSTTVWFEIGERSLWFEAYLLPAPPQPTEVFRQALVRNSRAWRAFFALDEEGGLIIRGRLEAAMVDAEHLDRVLGEVYEMVEIAFRPMLRASRRGRENSV